MKLEKLYDKVAATYDTHEHDYIIVNAQKIALEQLEDHLPSSKQSPYTVLEMGMGDGKFLQKVRQLLPEAELYGLDLSKQMLAIASERLKFNPIHSSVEQVDQHLESQTVNFTVAHFVCAYVGLEVLFNKVDHLLTSGGQLSLMTTTFESWESFQNQLKGFSKSYNPLKRLAVYFANRGISKTKVPKTVDEVIALARQHGFELQASQRLVQETHVENAEEATSFMISAGWGINVMNVRYIPYAVSRFISKQLLKLFTYPMDDEVFVEVVLLKKL